jgi:hypothetical protein
LSGRFCIRRERHWASEQAGAGGESKRPIGQALGRGLETRAERVAGAGGESMRPIGQALRPGLETRAERVFVAARTMIQHSAGGRPSGSDACAVRHPRERTSVYQTRSASEGVPILPQGLTAPWLAQSGETREPARHLSSFTAGKSLPNHQASFQSDASYFMM